jgi:hypothetical protein
MDFYAPNGDLQFPLKIVQDKDRYEQAAKILFSTLIGEFVLDPSIGLYPINNQKKKILYSRERLDSLIKNTLTKTTLFSLRSFTFTKVGRETTVHINLIINETNETLALSIPIQKHENLAGHTFVTRS